MAKSKVEIRTDGVQGFFERARETARKLDRGRRIAPEFTVTFENPEDMLRCLTNQRARLIREIKAAEATPISELAAKLRRNRRAVDRDVSVLESAGLLRTRYESNPGHGRVKIVEPVARQYQLTVNL